MSRIAFRGMLIASCQFNPRADEYDLFNEYGELMDTIKRHEFLAHPQLRNLPNGRHRTAHTQNHGGAANAAAARRLTANQARAAAIPGGITAIPGPGAILTLAQYSQVWAGLLDEKPKPPLRRDGIIAGEILGYRCWIIENGLLRSVYQTDVWHPSQVLEGRELEDWGIRGIHAWKDPTSKEYYAYIRAYLNLDVEVGILFSPNRPRRPAMITGSVFLWGDVVEHERGYRAEFARVRSLDWLYPDAEMMGRERETLNYFRRLYNV